MKFILIALCAVLLAGAFLIADAASDVAAGAARQGRPDASSFPASD